MYFWERLVVAGVAVQRMMFGDAVRNLQSARLHGLSTNFVVKLCEWSERIGVNAMPPMPPLTIVTLQNEHKQASMTMTMMINWRIVCKVGDSIHIGK